MSERPIIIDVISLIIQGLIAIGTVCVAILAIWGNWVRSILAPAKLSILPYNLRGTITSFTGGPRVIYYHLKVVNLRSWLSAKNCRVLLRSVYRQGPNQQFFQVPLPVPCQFVWAPAYFTPLSIKLNKEQILDFWSAPENETVLKPVLYWYPNNFQGYVEKNDCVKYCIELVADGYKAKKYYVFEVAWNGEWSDNLDEMSKNLTIREVKENDKLTS